MNMNFGATVYTKRILTLQKKKSWLAHYSNILIIIFFKCEKLIDTLPLKHDLKCLYFTIILITFNQVVDPL